MRCLDARLRFEGYLKADLPRDTAGEVRDHLQVCAACREYLLRCGAVERTPLPESASVSPGFSNRVLSAVASSRPMRPLVKMFIAISSSTLVLAVVVFTCLRYYFNPGDLVARAPQSELLTQPSNWLEQFGALIESPIAKFSLYAIGTLVLVLVLVALVDLGQKLPDVRRGYAAIEPADLPNSAADRLSA